MALSIVGKPTASEVLVRHTLAETVNFAANFSGSSGTIGINPTASYVLTVAKNGATVGTITFSTSGTVTFATTGGSAVAFAPGDVLTITAPASTDATADQLSPTLRGTRS